MRLAAGVSRPKPESRSACGHNTPRCGFAKEKESVRTGSARNPAESQRPPACQQSISLKDSSRDLHLPGSSRNACPKCSLASVAASIAHCSLEPPGRPQVDHPRPIPRASGGERRRSFCSSSSSRNSNTWSMLGPERPPRGQ